MWKNNSMGGNVLLRLKGIRMLIQNQNFKVFYKKNIPNNDKKEVRHLPENVVEQEQAYFSSFTKADFSKKNYYFLNLLSHLNHLLSNKRQTFGGNTFHKNQKLR